MKNLDIFLRHNTLLQAIDEVTYQAFASEGFMISASARGGAKHICGVETALAFASANAAAGRESCESRTAPQKLFRAPRRPGKLTGSTGE